MSDYEVNNDDVRDLLSGFKLIYAVLGLTFFVIVGRLWYLQVIEGDELREYSEKNRVKETKIPAARGLLYDRNGEILVDNVTGYDASITPQYAKTLEETAMAVSSIVKIPTEKIIADVKISRRKNGPFFPLVIKQNLSLDEVYRLEKLKLDHPGLNVKETILRHYPIEENGAQLFGYTGEISKSELGQANKTNGCNILFEQADIIGKTGIEVVWDCSLRGQDGMSFIEVDAHGRESTSAKQSYFELKPQKSVPGNNIVLTLDKDVQVALYKAMLEQKDKIGPRIGAAVVMKTNGEILAWVNSPSFNPNQFTRGISTQLWAQLTNDPFRPMRNKIIQDHYPPGSSIKPIIAVAALQEGKMTGTKIINAPGQMKYGNRIYHDSIKQGHGDINIKQAIERSSNIFFYKMGIELGIDNMAKYATLFGFGTKTGIDLKDEVRGHFPTKEWKQAAKDEPWQPGENLSNAIGQGFVLVNLLQMAVAYNVFATDGLVVKPFIIHKIIDDKNKVVKEFKPETLRDVTDKSKPVYVDKANLEIVKEGLRLVANGDRGTARWWKVPGVDFAGKTGTSQVRSFGADEIYDECSKKSISSRHHGLFIGYAPVIKPEVVIAVLTEHSCHGNTGSVPVVRDTLVSYFQKFHPEMLKSNAKKAVGANPDSNVVEETNE
jgi:penicillin-binding protein 2